LHKIIVIRVHFLILKSEAAKLTADKLKSVDICNTMISGLRPLPPSSPDWIKVWWSSWNYTFTPRVHEKNGRVARHHFRPVITCRIS